MSCTNKPSCASLPLPVRTMGPHRLAARPLPSRVPGTRFVALSIHGKPMCNQIYQSDGHVPPAHMRRSILGLISSWAIGSTFPGQSEAADFKCRGLRSRDLQLCLREARNAEEAGEPNERDEQFLKNKQYEQPGELVVTPEGVQYRDIDQGNPGGKTCTVGDICEISFTVYRLASGAYYKYSSGGTPVYLWSVGYGNEGKDDVGTVYRFQLGKRNAVPETVSLAMNGMRVGGRRRVLVPPYLGWKDNKNMNPRPDTFGASRRLEAHKDEALLFEAELVRVTPKSRESIHEKTYGDTVRLKPFQLPAPPTLESNLVRGK